MPGDDAAVAPEVPSMHHPQPPILALREGGADLLEDEAAYALLAQACDTALRTLYVSESCASTLRRTALAARELGQLPPREFQLVPLQGTG